VSRPQIFEVMKTLMERQPQALAAAAKAESEGRIGKALYYRTVAHEAAVLYAWLGGDDSRAAVARQDKLALDKAINFVDEQLAESIGAAA
jgi:hypothetical protein